MNWQPIETAPKGSGMDGPESCSHPDYVEPPTILIFTEEGARVGYYDWYYHEGYGAGAENGVSAWRGAEGERLYGPSHWMPLPPPPEQSE